MAERRNVRNILVIIWIGERNTYLTVTYSYQKPSSIYRYPRSLTHPIRDSAGGGSGFWRVLGNIRTTIRDLPAVTESRRDRFIRPGSCAEIVIGVTIEVTTETGHPIHILLSDHNIHTSTCDRE